MLETIEFKNVVALCAAAACAVLFLAAFIILLVSVKLEKRKVKKWRLKPIEPDIDHCRNPTCGEYRLDKKGKWIVRCPFCNDYQPF